MTDNETETTETTNNLSLRCLLGAAPPEGLGPEIQRLLELPDAALAIFPQVLALYLSSSLDAQAQQRINGYFEQHQLSLEHFVPMMRGLRMLFHAYAEANCQPDDYVADINALLDEQEAKALISITQPWIEEVAPQLRQEMLRQSVADHGKVVTSARWRIDIIDRSDRAARMSVPVGVITLNYQEGQQHERITLHLLPDQLNELRRALNSMLA